MRRNVSIWQCDQGAHGRITLRGSAYLKIEDMIVDHKRFRRGICTPTITREPTTIAVARFGGRLYEVEETKDSAGTYYRIVLPEGHIFCCWKCGGALDDEETE